MEDGYDPAFEDFFRSFPKQENILYQPLSDGDIRNHIPDVKIIKYNQLDEYNTIEQLLPRTHDYVVILTELKENNGHWLALLRDDKTLIFFDSYGFRPDKHLLWTPKYLRKQLGQDEPHLSYLLNHAIDNGFKVVFDETAYQNRKDGNIATCGRHVVYRIKAFQQGYRSAEQYKKLMSNMMKREKLNGDQLIIKIIP